MRRWTLLCVAALGVLTACADDERPNLVLVTLDTTRADRIGPMGDAEARTPVLDALAARGVVFERAYASVALTLPSHTSMLTGLGPNRHGVHDNGHFVVPAALETAAERLAASGYTTAAFVAAFVLDSQFGLDQGFALYDDEIETARDPLSFRVPSRKAEQVTDRAIAWLSEQDDAPFLLWVHYYDVHLPRRPPAPFDEIRDPYAGALAYVDTQIGRLRAALEGSAAGRESLILVLADHGESLGEHGEPTHGILAYDSTLHVPLIAVGPGFPAGARSPAFVATSDVAPTLLEAAGVAPLPGIDGQPLQNSLAPNADADRVMWFEAYGPHFELGWAAITGVRNARWKLTSEPQPAELYDVEADPFELESQQEPEPELVQLLQEAHARLKPQEAPKAGALDSEVAAQLAALGYAVAPQQFEPGHAPDPREFVEARGLVEMARERASRGRVADAIQVLEILAERPVVRVQALQSLAVVYASAGRSADAARCAEQIFRLTKTSWARLDLAEAQIREGRPEEAMALLDAGGQGGSPGRRAGLLRADASLALERPEDALLHVTPLLAANPADDEALALQGRARALRDGVAPEIERLGRALASAAPRRLTSSTKLLAGLLRLEGRREEALRALEPLGAEDASVLALRAELEAERGEAPRAIELYESALKARPSAVEWRRALAELYGPGRGDQALVQYDLVVAADPANAGLRVDRAVEQMRAGRWAEAEQDLREALRLDDGLPQAHFNLGLLSSQQGREEAAEQHYRRAVELDPDYMKAHLNLARIYRARGDPRAAVHAEQAARGSFTLPGGVPPRR